ncbi:Serine/threonine-protein kinase PknB [Gemmata sp. SH-PL17]|uniref:protein kinase domain-containing protein n=1 Tax=Gemmata sp. SH-PL17 TaxID=1630693 RepID=UPI00078C2E95|nr:protein kinase [Gemmata sp. SH-PL17]AMV28434.1 Serine/threonine-protein kinase PknB [Gemmata sp. SH-PL17]
MPDPSGAVPVPYAELETAFGDRYEIGTQLGHGGFGTVYHALDRRLNRRVALKVSWSVTADTDRLLREARALAQLRHAGIVTVYDVAVAGTCCFVVSELLTGPSLSRWLDEHRPAPADAVGIAAAVGDALAHAHARSIVHRDVKPSNIVFAEDRRPVLVDFGLALSDLDTENELGVVAGTPSFMSPEQAGGRGHRPDGRTDVYGLAATLYAMLCGRSPFRGRTRSEVIRQVREDEPQPLRQLRPDVSPELERVCLKGMAKLPGDRYTTAADFADALRRAVGLLPSLPAPPVPVVPAPKPAPPVVPAPKPAAPVAARSARAEWRQVTILQCSWEAGENDEDPMEQVTAFQRACAEVAVAHGGLPLQVSGTAFLACFGYPVAREDAPRQAVRAALALGERCAAVAVGTGPAVVTEHPPAPPVVVGDVVTITSALLSQGTASGVTVSHATFQLVDGFFDCEPLGAVRPRGLPQVPVFVVRAERTARNRVDATDPARLTPLVGRDREVELLKERWELTAEGVQNVILLVADPGLGKSRLVRVLREHVAQDADAPAFESTRSASAGGAVIEWFCSPYHQGSPFYPVIEYFDRAYRLSREPDAAARLDLLLARLREEGVHDAEDQALLAAMLSVPTGDRLPLLALTPERQREKTQDAVLNWLNARAAFTPLLFVVEDMHWVDPSTEALLAQFVERGGEARVLAVFTFRPEYDPPWKGKAVQTVVALNRLTRGQIAEMIRTQIGDRAIPQAVTDQIAERTDGVPLFVEEFTRLLVERGTTADEVGADIPTTLRDLLLARLDRMASDKAVVQLGAVIGRTFAHAVIRAASELDEQALRVELDKLVGAGLLFSKGSLPRTTYTFKHALIQDAAYQSMVKKRRQQFHRAVAEKLEERFPEVAQTQPELLARHFTEAGEADRAIDYWLRAGRRARAAFANAEAIEHLRRGLGVLAARPESPDRDALELQFQIPLAVALMTARGYAHPDLESVHARARELCERLGPSAPLFHVIWGNWALRLIRDELDEANRLAGELCELADRRADRGMRVESDFAVAITSLFRGEFARCRAAATRCRELEDAGAALAHSAHTGQNVGMAYRCYAGLAAWYLGFPDEAAARMREAVEFARGLGHPFSHAYALHHAGWLAYLLRDGESGIRYGNECVAVSEEQGFAFWKALGIISRGTGHMVADRPDQALAQVSAGLTLYHTTSSRKSLSEYHGFLAEIHLRAGRPEVARTEIEAGLAACERTNNRVYEAELHRLAGEVALATVPPDPTAAEAAFLRCLGVSQRQGARSWELRGATSLARLWRRIGRAAEARALLAAVYAHFTEGLGTPDLRDARTVLDELNTAVPT